MLLMLLSVAMLSLAAAPVGQWYLAWFALAPFFIAVGQAATMRRALARAWLGGIAFFAINLWWLWTASIPGTVVLVLYLAPFWVLAAGLLRGLLGPVRSAESDTAEGAQTTGLPRQAIWYSPLRVLGIATVWVAVEWLRCNIAIDFPWQPLGSTQSPLVVMCQVADLGGPWIVSFWVALPSALVAICWLDWNQRLRWRAASAMVVAVLVLVAGYGAWRLATTKLEAGPRVMVIQSNFPVLPGGAPTVDRQQAVEFFFTEMQKALADHGVNLVIMPEGEFPPLNDEARSELARAPIGPFLENTYQRLLAIAREHRTALLLGGQAVTGWSTRGSEHIGAEIRNSAYFFDPRASALVSRYDKINLVRFSERAPLAIGPEWLRRLAINIAANRATQPMFAGSLNNFRPFQLHWPPSNRSGGLSSAQFITPICLENIDPAIIATMIGGSVAPYKQAEFIANISSDGWFATQEKYAHLQSTIFRCIENRVPMVRCSNTGISAFIDSAGRVQETIEPGVAGFAVGQLWLDGRHTFYTRFGDVFAYACLGLVALAIVGRAFSRISRVRELAKS